LTGDPGVVDDPAQQEEIHMKRSANKIEWGRAFRALTLRRDGVCGDGFSRSAVRFAVFAFFPKAANLTGRK
jgi:hypothetical protein